MGEKWTSGVSMAGTGGGVLVHMYKQVVYTHGWFTLLHSRS